MEAYMFNAAWYCEGCAGEIRARLARERKTPRDAETTCPECGETGTAQSVDKARVKLTCGHRVHASRLDFESVDSGDWPSGPHADGGGESDTPQHCDGCQAFLENPLTNEGYAYVREAVAEGEGDPKVLAEWADHYEICTACRSCDRRLTGAEIRSKPFECGLCQLYEPADMLAAAVAEVVALASDTAGITGDVTVTIPSGAWRALCAESAAVRHVLGELAVTK